MAGIHRVSIEAAAPATGTSRGRSQQWHGLACLDWCTTDVVWVTGTSRTILHVLWSCCTSRLYFKQTIYCICVLLQTTSHVLQKGCAVVAHSEQGGGTRREGGREVTTQKSFRRSSRRPVVSPNHMRKLPRATAKLTPTTPNICPYTDLGSHAIP